MKITIDTGTLSRELFKLQGITNSKTSMAILQNVLLEAHSDGRLSFSATDLDVSFTNSVPCEVTSPGRATVRAKDLYEPVRALKTDTVTLEREDNFWVRMESGTMVARFVGMNPDEFPQLPSDEDVDYVSLEPPAFVWMLDRVFFSISTDEARPNLTGALFRLEEDGRISMVSTDGHRLSQVRGKIDPAPESVPEAFAGDGLIVSRKGLAELRRTLDLTAPTIDLGTTGHNAVFRQGDSTLFIRLIDGTFPNFMQVIPPEQPERRALVDRTELLETIKLVSTFAQSRTHNIRLQLEDDTCTVVAQDPEKGEAEEKMQIQYSGPLVRAAYNYRYWIDLLGVLESEQVSVEVIDTLSPTIVRELEGEDDDEGLFIVMPMRL